jgi:hypothetical protein
VRTESRCWAKAVTLVVEAPLGRLPPKRISGSKRECQGGDARAWRRNSMQPLHSPYMTCFDPTKKRPPEGAVFIGGGATRSRTGLYGFAIAPILMNSMTYKDATYLSDTTGQSAAKTDTFSHCSACKKRSRRSLCTTGLRAGRSPCRTAQAHAAPIRGHSARVAQTSTTVVQ